MAVIVLLHLIMHLCTWVPNCTKDCYLIKKILLLYKMSLCPKLWLLKGATISLTNPRTGTRGRYLADSLGGGQAMRYMRHCVLAKKLWTVMGKKSIWAFMTSWLNINKKYNYRSSRALSTTGWFTAFLPYSFFFMLKTQFCAYEAHSIYSVQWKVLFILKCIMRKNIITKHSIFQ